MENSLAMTICKTCQHEGVPLFSQEDGAPGCNSIKQSALVVMGNFGKDDHQVAAYTFF